MAQEASMYVVLGSTGHVGSALSHALLSSNVNITVVARDPAKARDLEARGARVVIADIRNVDELRRAYGHGERLYMLNPPADPATDTQAEERSTVASMLRALEGSGIKKVVAHSTFGARPGDLLGDLNVLYEMEQGLKRSGVPCSTLRAAYYMSNWDSAIASARDEGIVHTFFPADLKIPMVAPRDLGEAAAKLMRAPIEQTECVYVEGPERYSSAEVAAALAAALGRRVEPKVIPEHGWQDAFKKLGFSDRAAISYANMTRTVVDNDFPPVKATLHGTTSLDEYIKEQVAKDAITRRR
jgi:uncharacterized protein YbjT (DUF2867 family)